jgi:ATP-dependent Lon protease
MAETQIIERTADATTIRTGSNNQRLVLPNVVPLLPIRNIVVFPGTVMPLNVGRPKSKALLDEVMPGEKLIGVCTQRNADLEDPGHGDLYHVGVACMILKLFKMPDGNQSIIVHGLTRFRLLEVTQTEPFAMGRIEVVEDILNPSPGLDALMASVRQQANRVIELSPNTPDEAVQVLNSITAPAALADFLAANLPMDKGDVTDKQQMLEELDVERRLRLIAARLATQLDVLELQSKIQSQVKENIDKSQRRYYLTEQLKAIRKELGEGEGGVGGGSEVDQLRQKLEAAKLPELVMKEANRELSRLEAIPSASPEYGVIRTWLQIVSELPWAIETHDIIDLIESRKILDRDHHDLDKVKRRIIEYLAVLKLKRQQAQLAAKAAQARKRAKSPSPPPPMASAAAGEHAAGQGNKEQVAGTGTATVEPGQGNLGEENVGGAGAILCFVGPPGVGKTSLGKSIAEAMGRKFIRVALGGVRDEADIRGHRRTYIGSMPGRLIAELRKAGTKNPVMMLDEIDKMSSDFRGDPASAMLEVLDPAQNHTFTDHYLDVPFDLSKVLFIATANTMDTVPGPLRDRMEVIEIPGYTDADKLSISKQYLVPRQLEANGLSAKQAKFKDEALKWIIEGYTREAGVRNLERNIGSVARSIAAELVTASDARRAAEAAKRAGGKTADGKPIADGSAGPNGKAHAARDKGAAVIIDITDGATKVTVERDYVTKVLGPRRFEPELAQRTSVPGVATGMAYTPFGGEILFIEATRMPGRGGITLTGQIGDVMKESATAAFSLVRSRAEQLGIDPKMLAESDVHLHVPAGAIPKDGPSAGTAMFTALASLFLNRPVKPDVAMTGEITLRGLVLPIGGLKEKTLAARRAGIKTVIIPKRNEKDLPDVPEEVRDELTWHFVENADQVLEVALVPKPGTKGRPAVREAAAKPPIPSAAKGRPAVASAGAGRASKRR